MKKSTYIAIAVAALGIAAVVWYASRRRAAAAAASTVPVEPSGSTEPRSDTSRALSAVGAITGATFDAVAEAVG